MTIRTTAAAHPPLSAFALPWRAVVAVLCISLVLWALFELHLLHAIGLAFLGTSCLSLCVMALRLDKQDQANETEEDWNDKQW